MVHPAVRPIVGLDQPGATSDRREVVVNLAWETAGTSCTRTHCRTLADSQRGATNMCVTINFPCIAIDALHVQPLGNVCRHK